MLPDLTCGRVIGWVRFQGLSVAIHLVTDGGHVSSAPCDLPGDLCRCRLFAFIVDECDCCFEQVCRCHFGLFLCSDSLRLLTCVVVQNRPVRLLDRLYLCACWGVFYLRLVLSICVLQISVRMRHVTFAVSYLTANIESWNKACTLGRY